MKENSKNCVYLGEGLAAYGFGNEHPFGPQRHKVFQQAFLEQQLDRCVDVLSPVQAEQAVIELFHSHDYVEQVKAQSFTGSGYLDYGDTPAFKGVYEAAATVVGSVIDAVDRLLSNDYQHAFVPIAGLHHARRDQAAGFCVFNDCGVAIEYLKQQRLSQILYVDIDAHHADGVFYGFEDDPDLIYVDIHESGDYLYPGTGFASEMGKGPGQGMKLNIPMLPGSDDEVFFKVWHQVEMFMNRFEPEFVLLQAGVDSMAGDPITDLRYSSAVHAHVTRALVKLAQQHGNGRLLVLGGGGYNPANIASGWTAVVQALSED